MVPSASAASSRMRLERDLEPGKRTVPEMFFTGCSTSCSTAGHTTHMQASAVVQRRQFQLSTAICAPLCAAAELRATTLRVAAATERWGAATCEKGCDAGAAMEKASCARLARPCARRARCCCWSIMAAGREAQQGGLNDWVALTARR